MNNIKKISLKILVLTICISLAVISFGNKSLLTMMGFINNKSYSSSNFNRISDPSTMDSYQNLLLSDADGSRYAGRIWSDKSVFTNDLTLDMATDGYDGKVKLNTDFLNVFSALGSSQAWIGLPPTKTVIVIDNSGSMYSNNKTDWSKTRMDKTVSAVNESIDKLMRAGAFNEVSVVLFGNSGKNGVKDGDYHTATTIVPMGHYEVSDDEEQPYHYLDAGWAEAGVTDYTQFSEPIKDPSHANTAGGFVFVDKRYVNDTFKVDENIRLTDNGIKRYDTYRNGTTNINAGTYAAFKALLQEETKVKVAGITFNYIPSVVVLSDGAATDMLEGSWSNPTLQAMGFTNDRGNKKASYIKAFEDPQGTWTWDWNMYIDLIEKDGVPTLEQIGYGDGTLTDGHIKDSNPGAVGEQKLKEFANEVRSSQAAIILTTILNGSYMRAQVEKKFGGNCKFYTVSVDMNNPEEVKLPDPEEWFSGTANYTINTSSVLMNPNDYFNTDWLKEKGYIKQDADVNNLKDDDIVYEPYTVGYEIISAIIDAINAYDEFKNDSNSYDDRGKINKYVIYDEAKGLWDDMKDERATVNGVEYDATVPIGHNHSNAYFVSERKDVSFDNLDPGDTANNPYGLSNADLEYDYVTKSYYASSKEEAADKIAETFDAIVEDIVSSAFEPISGINDIGIEDSMTFMDPLGQYMDVKNKAITVSGETYDMGLLLFGKIHGITKTAVYDYNFNIKHRGPSHDSEDLSLPFEMGWYNKDGEFLGTSGSWDNGDTYYVDSETVRKYVPNLLEEGSMTDQQKNTIYTLYRFIEDSRNDEVHNPCYNDKKVKYKLSDIRIWVEDTENFEDENNDAAIDLGFDRAIYVNIPVSALPIEVANITIGTDGFVSSYTTNLGNKTITTPFRLFYGVGLQDSIFTDDGLNVDMAKISPEYLQKNKIGDVVYFYSNYYSNTLYKDYVTDTSAERTRGDAVLSFSPNETNRFYMYQNPLPLYSLGADDGDLETNGTYKDVPLLTDDEFNVFKATHQKITDAQTLSPDKWYYVILDYYLPGRKDLVHVAVSRLGKEFGSGIAGGSIEAGNYLAWYDEVNDTWVQYDQGKEKPSGDNWVIATRPGGLRVGDMAQSLRPKTTNRTSTAYNYYLPTISATTGTTSNDSNIIINSYLGNNGRLEVNDSLLFMTKEVETNEVGKQKIDNNKEFNFSVKLDDHEGDFEALKMYKNPYSNEWQLRLKTIDILTDNGGFLQNANNDLTVYRKNNGRSYYVYIGTNKAKSVSDENVFRLYQAPDSEDYVELTLSGMTTYVENPDEISSSLKTDLNKYKKYDDEHTLGSLDFWVKKAYLIPVIEVENGTWDGTTSGYDSLDEFVIAHLNPYSYGASELSSPYATQTAFLTQKVYFGYSDDKKPGDKPEGWTDDDWKNQEVNVAHITLKNNEGLMFSGLNSDSTYEIEELLTESEHREGYFFDRIHLAEKDTATIEGTKVIGQVNDNYFDEVDYINTFYAPVDLTIQKNVVGALADQEKEWTFDISLTPNTNVTLEDSYETLKHKANGEDETGSISLMKQPSGNYTGSVTLKHGEKITLKGIPQNTQYEVTETLANRDDYVTTAVNAKGTLVDNETSVTFENAKYSKHDIVLSKEVLGALGDQEKEWAFNINFTPQENIPFAKSYAYLGSKDGMMELTDNHDGSYTGTISLKHNESVTIKNIPEGTSYEIVEKDASQDGYITLKNNETGLLKDEPSVNVKFTNIKYSRHQLKLEKIVTGGAGDKEKEWTFKVTFTPAEDVIFDTTYHYVGGHAANGVTDHADGDLHLTKQGDSYTGTIKLKHGESVTIENIPERTKYKVEEVEANQEKYYTMATLNTEGELTKDLETVRFTNTKLSKHDITISKKVTGAWADEEKEWTFKIILKPLEYVILDKEYQFDGTKSGKISFTSNTDGTYTGEVLLKHNDTVTIKGLPEETKYKVEEEEANTDGYTTRVTGDVEGTLTYGKDNPSISFNNIKLSEHSLTISKEVLGSDGDQDKVWNFIVKFTPQEGVTLSDSYPITSGNFVSEIVPSNDAYIKLQHNSDGTSSAHVTLKHGQSLTINNLPQGTQYEVVEEEANTDGYVTWTTGQEKGTLIDTDTFMVKYNNKKPSKHSLTISKEVAGGAGDKNKEWTFEITLTPDDHITLLDEYLYDGSKTGLIAFAKQSDGSSVGTITLKHNQTVTINGLPEKTTYRVREKEANQDEYITHVTDEDGILNDDVKVSYKNTKLSKHNIIISKEVFGNLGNKEKEWTFKIKLVAPSIKKLDKKYAYVLTKKVVQDDIETEEVEEVEELEEGTIDVVEKDGYNEATIKLKHNEKIEIKDLPEGTEYEVTEEEANQDDYVTITTENTKGILNGDTPLVKFSNKNYSKHSISIEKKLEGTNVESEREWTFKITLKPDKDAPFKEAYAYTGLDEDGIINFTPTDDEEAYEGTITLKGGDKIVIEDIPYDTLYEVIEEEANQDKYQTTYTDNEGIVNDDIVVTITNKRNIEIPLTGDQIKKFIIIFEMALITLLSGILLCRKFLKSKC